eukprot:TRINITY_DN70159_c0_g1_i1.p1 TRINITY_DN70159_c0_g1~~TRINITY_DN70159_c0_g1_i1.p1  ORF type:complete len:872 (+),score=339.11 TRINITY_DN70159_c0_g1_i1:95-2710(+)
MAEAAALASFTELEFERDLQRDPFCFKHWWRYLQFKHAAPARERNLLHERALQCIPGSYKLWHQYLQERVIQAADRPLDDPLWGAVTRCFERALIFMNKMPRIWQDYLSVLMRQHRVAGTRRAIDRALQSLPITQHEAIWRVAIKGFAKADWVPAESALRVWRRYLQLEPNMVEDFVIYLRKHKRWNDIINVTIKALNDPRFVSVKGKTRHEIWVELCALISRQGPALRLEDKSLTVENIIRSGITKFPAEVGQLWCALADHCIRCRHFDKARDVYEAAVTGVGTVKDFSQVFDSYAQFEESLLTSKMEQLEGEEDSPADQGEDPYTAALALAAEVPFSLAEEVDYRLERLQALMERRAGLLNSVLLRQNPHNVHEWHSRSRIFRSKPEKVVQTFTEAVKTVDHARAVGKPHTLWTAFAKWYEGKGDARSARLIFERAVREPFRTVDDLAAVWCEYAEMEVRHKKYRKALELLKRATATNFVGQGSWKANSGPVADRLWRSVKLWCFYADLNESLCTVRSTQNVYDRMIYLRVATPLCILNYARYLQEHNFWEESFKAYEQGVSLFRWPLVHEIWVAYASAFVGRFKGRKSERARDLFAQATAEIPAEFAPRLYLMWARYEERYGLARECLQVYDAACSTVPNDQKPGMYRRYVAAARKFFGVTRTREVYDKAIRNLPEQHIAEMGLEWAEVERQLGEIDRCRSIHMHCAQFVDPRKENTFWPAWHQFEVVHGSEQSFREMLRIRRSVQATFSTAINLGSAAEQAKMERQRLRDEEEVQTKAAAADPQQQAEGGAGAAAGAGKVTANPEADRVHFVPLEELAKQQAAMAGAAAQPQESAAEDFEVQQQPVPSAVFEGVAGGTPVAKRPRAE